MSVFCTYPWKQLFSDSYGVYMPCCMATVDHPHNGCWHGAKSDFPAPKVNEVSPSEFFYSDYMKQLRSDMRGGKTTPLINKVCANCINEEKEGRRGLRNPQQNEPLGRVIEVKLRLFGNACNLSCYMCRIKDSSSRIKQTEKLMEIDPEFGEMLEYDKLLDEMKHGGMNYNVTEDIKKLAPRIQKIYIIGGEPFIMPRHYEVLNALIEIDQAKNIILIGDQMQLGQPTQGSHPGESGYSVLDYLLEGKDTIPEDKGIFLNTSWRMEPSLTNIVSELFYDKRLMGNPFNENNSIYFIKNFFSTLPSSYIKIRGVLYLWLDFLPKMSVM